MPYTKKTCIKDLNIGPETIKLLEENIARTLNDINQSKILYDPPPRVMEIKTSAHRELCSMLCGSLDGRGVLGENGYMSMRG